MHSGKNNDNSRLEGELNKAIPDIDMEWVLNLLRLGAEANICCSNRETALHKFVLKMLLEPDDSNQTSHLSTLKSLLELGVDVHAKNAEGYTALQLLLKAERPGTKIALLACRLYQESISDPRQKKQNAGELFAPIFASGIYETYPASLQNKMQKVLDLETEELEKIYNMDASARLVSRSFQKIGQALGKGRSGSVFPGVWNNENVAIKEIRLEGNYGEKLHRACKEIAFIQCLNRDNLPYVIHLKTYRIEKDKVSIVMEFANKGSLADFIENNAGPNWGPVAAWGQSFQWVASLAGGIRYMHERNILPCDLKPDNVVIVSDPVTEVLQAKFIDLELAQNAGKPWGKYGSAWYNAPELNLPNAANSMASDTYGLGMLVNAIAQWKIMPDFALGEIIVSRSWYSTEKRQALFTTHLLNGMKPWIPTDSPKIIQDFIRMATVYPPSARSAATDLENHLLAEKVQEQHKDLPELPAEKCHNTKGYQQILNTSPFSWSLAKDAWNLITEKGTDPEEKNTQGLTLLHLLLRNNLLCGKDSEQEHAFLDKMVKFLLKKSTDLETIFNMDSRFRLENPDFEKRWKAERSTIQERDLSQPSYFPEKKFSYRNQARNFCREIEKMQTLSKVENLMQIQGYHIDLEKNRFNMVMQDIPLGRLIDCYREQKAPGLKAGYSLWNDLVSGITDLHAQGMVYHNLQPFYMLLFTQADAQYPFKLKIAGLDNIHPVNAPTEYECSALFSAPEVLQGQACAYKSNVYSLGIMGLSIMEWKFHVFDKVYTGKALEQFKTEVIHGKRPEIPKNYPQSLTRQLREAWHQHQAFRPESAAFRKTVNKQHDFFRQQSRAAEGALENCSSGFSLQG